MEKRNISITLKEAKELYKNGDEDLKSLILTSFSKDELITPDWQNIKTFEDACQALRLESKQVDSAINQLSDFGKHHVAIYRLNIIRKALNGDWSPKMAEEHIYYPYVKFYSCNKIKEKAKINGLTVQESFDTNGNCIYYLAGGRYDHYTGGVGHFEGGYGGSVLPTLGLLCCKSKEIAEHMSRYFAKEIFEACYAQHDGTYKWCE